MSAPIDRQVAVNELIAMREHIDARMSIVGCIAYDMAIEALRQPEIIQCKDCKWWETYKGKPEQYEYNCYQLEVFTNSDFFCANGIRRRTDATFN